MPPDLTRKEFPCDATIDHTRDTTDFDVTGPVTFTIGNGIRKIPCPDNRLWTKASNVVSVRGYARPCVYFEPHRGGHRRWLILSWNHICDSMPAVDSQAVLDELDERGPCNWIENKHGLVNMGAVWDRKGMRLLTAYINKKAKEEIALLAGDDSIHYVTALSRPGLLSTCVYTYTRNWYFIWSRIQ